MDPSDYVVIVEHEIHRRDNTFPQVPRFVYAHSLTLKQAEDFVKVHSGREGDKFWIGQLTERT